MPVTHSGPQFGIQLLSRDLYHSHSSRKYCEEKVCARVVYSQYFSLKDMHVTGVFVCVCVCVWLSLHPLGFFLVLLHRKLRRKPLNAIFAAHRFVTVFVANVLVKHIDNKSTKWSLSIIVQILYVVITTFAIDRHSLPGNYTRRAVHYGRFCVKQRRAVHRR